MMLIKSWKPLLSYFRVLTLPVSISRGNDRGTQYRTEFTITIYKTKKIIEEIRLQQQKYKKKIVVEVLNLQNFYKAEEYHQDSLKKSEWILSYYFKAHDIIMKQKKYPVSEKRTKNEIKHTTIQVTQQGDTERAFQNDCGIFLKEFICGYHNRRASILLG